jgi:hypothetical protein
MLAVLPGEQGPLRRIAMTAPVEKHDSEYSFDHGLCEIDRQARRAADAAVTMLCLVAHRDTDRHSASRSTLWCQARCAWRWVTTAGQHGYISARRNSLYGLIERELTAFTSRSVNSLREIASNGTATINGLLARYRRRGLRRKAGSGRTVF